MRPGLKTTIDEQDSPRNAPTDTGVAMFAAMTDRGPANVPMHLRSLDDYTRIFGTRNAFGFGYDAADVYFREGGADLLLSRVVGPNPVNASANLPDRAGAPINTLRVEAASPGEWANGANNGVRLAVEDGTLADTFRLVIRLAGVVVERFDNLSMDAADPERYAPTRLLTSLYVRGTDLNSATAPPDDNPAVVADIPLVGGTDDHAAAGDAHWDAALGSFAHDLGPGQVAMPGRGTEAAAAALRAHAEFHDGLRVYYADLPDQSDRAFAIARADALGPADPGGLGFLFGSWFDAPAASSGGGIRAIPGSVLWAAKTAAIDAAKGLPGFAPAGDRGTCRYVLDVRGPAVPFTEDDITDLNAAGVNVAINWRVHGVQLWGFRTLSRRKAWRFGTARRIAMGLKAEGDAYAHRFVFDNIDRQGINLGRFGAGLRGIAGRYWQGGVLFGATAEDAFTVDVSEGPGRVNTPENIADGIIAAHTKFKPAPFAEEVQQRITNVPPNVSL